jgi:hypothetical protein
MDRIMRTVATIVACLAFAQPLAAQTGPRVAGYETYAVVAPAADEVTAQPFAQAHCTKYGRFAKFRYMDGARAIFDCTVQKPEPNPVKAPTFSGRGIY